MTGSSFSVATTAFISLAICAIISYGVFYYFKQRLSLIEQSQMEQARIMQAIISRGLHQQHPLQQQQQQSQSQQLNTESVHKEITITQNSLIEVSSDEESATDSESETSDTESETGSESGSESGSSEDKWSVGDEIHQTDAYHNEFNEMCEKRASSEKKQIHIDNIENIENIDIENIETNAEPNADDTSTKKIISLNSAVLNHESDDDDDEDDHDESSSSESEEKPQKFDVKIGYKATSSASKVNLNYGNMSVPALRQLAKERGLGGDDADLQKLRKKDLVQLLQ